MIEHGALNGMPLLERLEIAHNHLLSHIDHTILDVLPNLQYLNLRGNALNTLQLNMPNDMANNMIILDVRDNPFTCNCSLDWLRSYFLRGTNYSQYSYVIPSSSYAASSHLNSSINENNSNPFTTLNLFMSISQVYCDSPHILYNKLIMHLHSDDLGCFQLENNIPIITAIMIGILLVCGVLIIFVIRCKLAGIVKSQWFSEGSDANTLRNDLDYRKPDFAIIHSMDLNIDENRHTAAALEVALRCPLKLTPITELWFHFSSLLKLNDMMSIVSPIYSNLSFQSLVLLFTYFPFQNVFMMSHWITFLIIIMLSTSIKWIESVSFVSRRKENDCTKCSLIKSNNPSKSWKFSLLSYKS